MMKKISCPASWVELNHEVQVEAHQEEQVQVEAHPEALTEDRNHL
jgi:hypothetical protein